ncbi:TetR family transcriptional regulator [Pokkaliibacter plantistimulans]|uniref:TetR family transcriptional regulator n=1 Tax=Proteobacteria bacterium 228 TaxID=2083153 RepID=A0A2S5KVV0_9PROT|nr:TetR/AcrR family transcriptional regulator [Pokkaliibacter plantistimulans]PPC78900.1 TetR family transcriptional regulator [Pokkaliibacter plantistimulans]
MTTSDLPLGKRAQQAKDTRDKILKAAVRIFAKNGYSGGRIESISKAAASNDRMIYYYFGSKEKLFIEVLEHIYLQFNQAERKLKLDLADPAEALQRIVEFTWNYYLKHPEFVLILSTENLHRGKHSKKSANIKTISSSILANLAPVLEAGQQRGLFRKDASARNLYLTISSLTYFYNSNQYTLSVFMDEDFASSTFQQEWLAHIKDVVMRSVLITL